MKIHFRFYLPSSLPSQLNLLQSVLEVCQNSNHFKVLSQPLSGSYVSSIFEIWPFATQVKKLITLQYELSKKHSTLFSRNISSGSRLLRATTSSCSGDIHVTFFNGLLVLSDGEKEK